MGRVGTSFHSECMGNYFLNTLIRVQGASLSLTSSPFPLSSSLYPFLFIYLSLYLPFPLSYFHRVPSLSLTLSLQPLFLCIYLPPSFFYISLDFSGFLEYIKVVVCTVLVAISKSFTLQENLTVITIIYMILPLTKYNK